MADMDTYPDEPRHYEDDRDYPPPRDRSRSPGPDRDGDIRVRDEPTNGRNERGPAGSKGGDDDDAANPGSNLFVTGIHPRLSEDEVSRLFEKYGVVEKCNIMRDPHTRESRGFGFVKMTTPEEADAAKEGLQGEVFEGRTLSIEKARRARPRTPTPGKYFGPPKRDERPRGGYRDRYDASSCPHKFYRAQANTFQDRGPGRRDDYRRGGGYRDRYDDRSYSRRDDYAPRGDRYRDDRYGGDRRGGGSGSGSGSYGYDRPPRGGTQDAPRYGGDAAAPRDAPPARNYDDRRNYD